MLMKVIVFTLVLILCYVSVSAKRDDLKEIPKELAHKQGCYIEEIKDVIPFFSSVAPVAICKRINCFEDSISYDLCEEARTDDPKCFITDTDYSRPYPQCCSTIECDLEVSQI